MAKTYEVTDKNGRKQIVKGVIVFFSGINTDIPQPVDAVYLNVDEVMSVVERPSETKEV